MRTLNIHQYLVDQSGRDWAELLAGWVPPLPECFTLWLVNRFGDVFAIFDDESVHMLDLGTGSLTQLAADRDEFAEKLDLGDNANNWLMIPLVDRCVAAGMRLAANQCYGYKIPPVLGGGYKVENLYPVDLSVHYSLMSDIYLQIRDLPDEAKVKMVTVNRSGTVGK